MHWHVRNQSDPGHLFLRDVLQEVASRHASAGKRTKPRSRAAQRIS
jgi:hypothetical protein